MTNESPPANSPVKNKTKTLNYFGRKQNGLKSPTAAILAAAALAATIIYAVILNLLPPTSKDALIHHLAIPKLWLMNGGFVETPWASFSYYPMNLDLLYLVALAAGSDIAAKFIHLAFGLGSAILIFFYILRRLTIPWALLGSLLFLTTPAILRLCTSAYVDLGLTFFITSSVVCLSLWAENRNRKYFLLSAVSAGLAAGVKYNGMIGVVFLSMAAALIQTRKKKSNVSAVSATAGYALIALLFFSPWLIKNYLLTGNPVYPLYNGLFGLPNLLPDELKLTVFQIRSMLYKESWLEILLIPIRVFFQGTDYSPRYFDGVLNPILLFGPIIAVFRPKFMDARPLAVLSALWIITVFFKTSFIVRYIAPIIPLLCILTVYGLFQIRDVMSEQLSRKVVVLILASSLIFNGIWAVGYWKKADPVPYLTKQVGREEYLAGKLPQYPAIAYINSNTRPDARILLLFAHSQGYYLDRDYFYYTYFSGEALRPILENASDPDSIVDGFKKMKVTHLLAREDLLFDYLQNVWGEDEVKLWLKFASNHLRRVFSHAGYSVFEIKGGDLR